MTLQNKYSVLSTQMKSAIFIIVIILVMSPVILMIFRSNDDQRTFLYTSRTVYVNKGDAAWSLDTTFYTFNMFMNTSRQTVFLNTENQKSSLDQDSNGNSLLIFNPSTLGPGENETIAFSLRVTTSQQHPPKIRFQTAEGLENISNLLRQQFCVLKGTWRNDSALHSLAQTIWTGQNKTSNILRIVISLANWVGTNIKSVSHDIPYYPNETYAYREGDCDDQANLLITLCRSLGIPAYLQIGCLQWQSSTRTYWNDHVISQLIGISYHAWAMIFIPPWGWLPFDMTLGWAPNNPFNVITSARAWKPETIVIANITEEDWAGDGRRVKELVTTSTVDIHYKNELIAIDDVVISILRNDRLVSGLLLIVMISISFWTIKRVQTGMSEN